MTVAPGRNSNFSCCWFGRSLETNGVAYFNASEFLSLRFFSVFLEEYAF